MLDRELILGIRGFSDALEFVDRLEFVNGETFERFTEIEVYRVFELKRRLVRGEISDSMSVRDCWTTLWVAS